ncbi:PGF-pre-PGF domain-containing protein [Methanococcoides sp. FTZ1]|uniref:PGF-pre-PGF domain-containing protein n=1 Tax=Methanococcoides sp. FTZ1 TaxID=3439061 RepID=UPI003F83D8F0
MSIDTAKAEAFENIDEKDVRVIYVMRDLEKSFTFRNEALDITYINISTDLNVGNVEATVESLKSTSSMVSDSPEGRVYKNINIWVGDNKLKQRLRTSEVGFRVNRTWLEDNDVSDHSVRLSIYLRGDWNILPTEKIDEDDWYIYYEANTSGDLRTHFAIVEYVEEELVSSDVVEEGSDSDLANEESALVLEEGTDIGQSKSEELDFSNVNMFLFLIPILMVLLVLSSSYAGRVKEPDDKKTGPCVGLEDTGQVEVADVSEIDSDITKDHRISGKTAENESHDATNENKAVDIKKRSKK